MQTYRILILVLLCAGGQRIVEAQSTNAANRALSLQECLQLALQHNLDLKIERVNPEIAQYNLGLAYSGYDPVFNASGGHNYRKGPTFYDSTTHQYILGSDSDVDSINTGLQGLGPMGFRYSAGGSFSDSVVSQLGRTTENISGNASLQMSQPLLKNFWIDSTRMNIQVSKKSLKMSELGVQEQIMTVVNSVEQAYFDLIFARENLKVQEEALRLAERLLAENKKRVEVGSMAVLDEKQAESQVAARKADVISSQRILSTAQNTLKNLLSEEYSEWNNVEIEPSDPLTAPRQLFSLQDSWSKGMTMRPDLQSMRMDLQRQDITIRYNRNQTYPQLDVVGSYGRAGSVEGSSWAGMLDQISDGVAPSWSIGAQMSIPLSNRAARERLKTSRAQKQQAVLNLKKTEQNAMVQIDNAVKLAQANFERIDATRKAREFAEAALDAEQKKLENGKSTSFFVLQLQRDLTAARFEEIRSITEYNKALASLAMAEGTILERNRIDMRVK